jgi:superfamily I DNA and/or RNA helicase/very-short-patch-repair endonuclease
MRDPKAIDPTNYRILFENKELFGITGVFVFVDKYRQYWHICFKNGVGRDFEKSTLTILASCLVDKGAKNVFDYLKQTADLINLRSEDGTLLLSKQYEKLEYVGEDKVFSNYLNPVRYPIKQFDSSILVFPFGCNASQYTAVQNALENQLSVVQGPPGTGKTQTILTIIANLLVMGKTVQVVSSNNSATKNVLDKLASYNLDFNVAALGNSSNKDRFILEQTGLYPSEMQTWSTGLSGSNNHYMEIHGLSEELRGIFMKQNQLALAKQSLKKLDIELHYFKQYLEETGRDSLNAKVRRKLDAEIFLRLWIECQKYSGSRRGLYYLFKLKCRFFYGIANWSSYRNEVAEIVALFQFLFYQSKRVELVREIQILGKALVKANQEQVTEKLTDLSMQYLKEKLYCKYGKDSNRRMFSEEDLWKNPMDVQQEYPVVLSTTFSARSSLCKDAEFDYIIIDEASQVDVTTGALALSCARNAVIVGDTMQLPNVVSRQDKLRLQAAFDSSAVSQDYNCASKSFLQSVCDAVPGVPTTLLREHYRCHPGIINFCNQKFYRGELLVMTEDAGEKDVVSLIKTVKGNHQRDRMNQRQIDVVARELLPNLPFSEEDIGIIAPYNNQVEAIRTTLSGKNIEVSTVHKYQGREKEVIIITTVDDEVTDFSDDPNLLNVAVSRAKKRLYLVVSGNEQPKDSNIGDLIDYIEYNNFSVVRSNVYSVFDFLYRHYRESRIKILNTHRRVSEYDSENLMYVLITDVLQENDYSSLDVLCHQSLNMLIRDPVLLNGKEAQYAMNGATHLDFLIYNRIGKKPVLAIEVDGYSYHKKGTVQSKRDAMKDKILNLYGIPLLRFATNGSGEKDILMVKLQEVLHLSTPI